jgi:hypothetical protein
MSNKPGIHAADVETSSRLKAALNLLRQRGPEGATTFEIFQASNDMAVHSTVSELRANGLDVSPAIYVGKIGKRRVFKYVLHEARVECAGQMQAVPA